MAEKPSWQSQNYLKGGNTAGPQSMGSKIAGDNLMQMHSKIARPTVHNYADGGSVDEDKAAGLEASKGESVGFFERLRMGNIDDPNSEAYRRFGAGRGESERMKSMPDQSDAETKRLGLDKTETTAQAPKFAADENQSSAEVARLQRQNDSGASTPVGASKVSEPAARAKPVNASKSSAEIVKPVMKMDDESAAETKRILSKATGTSASGGQSVMFTNKKAADSSNGSAAFDPDRIDNFTASKPAPKEPEQKYKTIRGMKVPVKDEPSEKTVRVHPRTGRPY